MSTAPAMTRPVDVDELKRAWQAVTAGQFRAHPSLDGTATSSPRGRRVAAENDWSPAPGEHTLAVLGCSGSAGASTLALAIGLASAGHVRVVECCTATASGLAAATTAELGLHPTRWRQGTRDHVLIERASEVLVGADEVPLPTDAEHENQLTILDVGWEPGQLLATDCWLAEAVRSADQIVLATTATVPGMRRASVAVDLLATDWQPDQLALAVLGPRRKKWTRGLEHAGGPAIRSALNGDRCVEIPEDRGLAVNGLDSRPVPTALVAAARHLVPTAYLPDPASTASSA